MSRTRARHDVGSSRLHLDLRVRFTLDHFFDTKAGVLECTLDRGGQEAPEIETDAVFSPFIKVNHVVPT